MNYQEWKETFADGGSKEGLETVDKSEESGIINKKVRIINLFNESDNNLFDFEEIEAEMLKSNVGRNISKFIEYENFIITMNYDLDAPPELMGDVLRRDINVYVVNHNNIQEIAEFVRREYADLQERICMAINTLNFIKEIKEKGKVECPLCHSGYFIARSDIPTDKQTQFKCTHCKEKLILRIKM